jgi:crossover junction endodeoxyribonuclease RuvC
VILGIDPGMSGGLVLLDGQQWHSHLLTPSGNKRLLVGEIVDWLNARGHLITSMPGQGVSTTFTFGRSYGCIEGVIEALRFPHTEVTPQGWKGKFGFVGLDKDAPRQEAARRWPEVAELRAKGKGQALADAAFIALWGAS